MDFKTRNSVNLNDTFTFTKKLLQSVTLTLLLFSFALPLSHSIISTKAQDANKLNPNTKITVEIVKKNQSAPETKETTLGKLQTNSELADLNKVDSFLEKTSLDLFSQKTSFEATDLPASIMLTPELIQSIEAHQGIVIDEVGQAYIDQSVLTNMGLEQEQITVIQNSVSIYNAQPVKSISVSYVPERKVSQSNYFTLQAQAGCNYEYTTSFHYWGVRTWVNNCIIQDIKVYGYISIGPVLIKGGLPGQILGFVVGAYIELIDAANSRCDNRGAYIDKPFIGKFYIINNVC